MMMLNLPFSSTRPTLAAVAVLAAFAACSTRPAGDERVRGTLSGHVYVAGPVAGAIVAAYPLDLDTGARGDVLAESEPTGDDGAFRLELGAFAGPLLLEARGAAATYVEPASGALAALETASLRAAVVRRDGDGGELAFGFELGDERDDVVIGPWSELAVDRAVSHAVRDGVRLADTLDQSYRLFAAHVEHDFFAARPTSLVDGPAGPFDRGATAGLLASALSHLARRVAVAGAASPASVSSLALLDALRRDVRADGVFDGRGPDGAGLSLGACPDEAFCALSGRTLRGDLAESAALFLLDDARNASGYRYGDAAALLDAISYRESALFPGPGDQPDRTAPQIRLDGLADGDLVSGSRTFVVTVADAFTLATVAPLRVESADAALLEGEPTLAVERAVTPTAHTLTVSLDSTALADGPFELVVEAVDTAGNAANRRVALIAENVGPGVIVGTATAGGRIRGAAVTVYDATGGARGAVLGEAITDDEGRFAVEVAEVPDVTALWIEIAKPLTGDADYLDTATGATLLLSAGHTIEAVIADWQDGQRRAVHVTPWTHIAAEFARGLLATRFSGDPGLWDVAVADAHGLLEAHLGGGLDLRAVGPADLTDPAQGTTFNAQVRYGLALAGLGELARAHADTGGASPASMNTLTLLDALAADLRGDATGEPVFDGRDAGGALAHGEVAATSYWTRVDLAIGMIDFIERNPRDASALVESDVLDMLDGVALNDEPRLYPADAPPTPYDVQPPVAGFTAPTPADHAVLRGTVAVAATATDNRRLRTTNGGRDGFDWQAPAGIAMSLLDQQSSATGPWLLSGELDLDAFADGPVTVEARAEDEVSNRTVIVRTFIVDKTAPALAITSAVAGGDALAAGGWTGAPSIEIAGTASDANGFEASYRFNGGPWVALPVSGTWTVSLDLQPGANTIEVRAQDPAGNVTIESATYHRDAAAPTVALAAAEHQAQIADEAGYTVTIKGGGSGLAPGAGVVTYNGLFAPIVEMAPGVAFAKFATRYDDASRPNLPIWRWQVGDDVTAASAVSFEVRLRRGAEVLTDWIAVPHAAQAGFNRELVVAGHLHPEVYQVSGVYTVEARATDAVGNTSGIATASWTQTILAPPIRTQVASLSGVGSRYPGYYSLAQDRFAPITQTDALRVATVRVDNPHNVAIDVRMDSVVGATWSIRRMHQLPELGSVAITDGCDGDSVRDQNDAGTACFSAPAPSGEHASAGNVEAGIGVAIEVTDLNDAPIASAGGVVTVAAGSSVLVHVLSDRWSWLAAGEVPMSEVAALGALSDVSAYLGPRFRRCHDTTLVGGEVVCTDQRRHRVAHVFTRALVTIDAVATVRARLGAAAAWAVDGEPGAVVGLAPYVHGLATAETGYTVLTDHGAF